MKLTDMMIRQAKPKAKQYKLSDGGGMYLLVHPNGSKYFRMKYYYERKEKVASFGIYPIIGLQDARAKRLELKQGIAKGIDVVKVQREEKLKALGKYSFETIAMEWYENKKPLLSKKYARDIINRLKSDIFSQLGHKDINEILTTELLEVLKGIEKRGAIDLAKRLLQICGQIFRYAIITEKAERDITGDLRGGIKNSKKR